LWILWARDGPGGAGRLWCTAKIDRTTENTCARRQAHHPGALVLIRRSPFPTYLSADGAEGHKQGKERAAMLTANPRLKCHSQVRVRAQPFG